MAQIDNGSSVSAYYIIACLDQGPDTTTRQRKWPTYLRISSGIPNRTGFGTQPHSAGMQADYGHPYASSLHPLPSYHTFERIQFQRARLETTSRLPTIGTGQPAAGDVMRNNNFQSSLDSFRSTSIQSFFPIIDSKSRGRKGKANVSLIPREPAKL